MATLGEQIRSQAGQGQLAGGIRGADMQTLQAGQAANSRQQQLDNAMRQFYSGQLDTVRGAQDRLDLENYRAKQRLAYQNTARTAKVLSQALNPIATILGGWDTE
jgi:hypothetical protein